MIPISDIITQVLERQFIGFQSARRCCAPLLARCTSIRLQNAVDNWLDLRPRPFGATHYCGTALPSASRASQRCTRNLRPTPAMLPMPNPYSWRISSNSCTVALLLRTAHRPNHHCSAG